ncbi:hypothetical protein GCM10009720_01020 [Yaniella flava]|uniref:Prepilin type IV endopeptidase peptidase domain-containing protein n=1 Tax=Yaniella flava TaxID=287930 RepID=A0ABN2U0R5_9MICC|nr:prepilin peptidase [Micrococcaceae bacterium]
MIHLITEQLTSTTPAPVAMTLLVAALVWFGVCATTLFVVDVREHRLPNTLNALLFVGGAALLIASTLTSDSASVLADRWGMTLIGSGAYLAVMFILHLLTRAGLGMGDVKLAAGLGLYTGFLGFEALIAGFVLAFVVGGLQAVYLVVFRGAKKSTRIAFGPAMIIGCGITLLM